MSKNIYRVNKKSDLDEIMRNNFYKPICIVFVSKLMDTKIYEEIATALMTVVIIIYCEVLPKTYAVRHSETVALFIAPLFIWIFKILSSAVGRFTEFIKLNVILLS